MNFLQKVGQILATGLRIWLNVAPALQQEGVPVGHAVPVVDKLTLIGQAVDEAAGIIATLKDKNLTDDEKRQIASVKVAQVVLVSSLVAGHEIADPTLFHQAVQNLSGAVADIKRSLKSDKVEGTESKNL